jgi:prepilin-type N-terminal cleavage/methylation domain-containing protein
MRHRNAFTVIELLVVVTVIAVLLAISIPALSGARKQARIERCISVCRSCVQSLALYAADFRDQNFYFQTPGDPAKPTRLDGVQIEHTYFAANRVMWFSWFPRAYFDADRSVLEGDSSAAIEANRINGYPEGVVRSQYKLAGSLFAAPQYWDTDRTPLELNLIAGTRTVDVRFPSAKGLVCFDEASSLGTPRLAAPLSIPVAFADASAATMPGTAWGQVEDVARPWGSVPVGIFGTRHGLGGRDR